MINQFIKKKFKQDLKVYRLSYGIFVTIHIEFSRAPNYFIFQMELYQKRHQRAWPRVF